MFVCSCRDGNMRIGQECPDIPLLTYNQTHDEKTTTTEEFGLTTLSAYTKVCYSFVCLSVVVFVCLLSCV